VSWCSVWGTEDILAPSCKTPNIIDEPVMKLMMIYVIWPEISLYILIGGLEHEFYVPFHIWDNPSHWLSYFSRWLKPPTRSLLTIINHIITIYKPYNNHLVGITMISYMNQISWSSLGNPRHTWSSGAGRCLEQDLSPAIGDTRVLNEKSEPNK
jgi:hypothetical protein